MTQLRYVACLGLALGASACLEQCAPGRVGAGVARLSVRNVGALVQALNANGECGFESPAVKSGFSVDGAPGQAGSVTWTVERCDLDFGRAPQRFEDCSGKATTLSGRAVVTAKRVVRGTLTGDPAQPVVPFSDDAVTITLENVAFDRFLVTDSKSDAELTQLSGQLSAVVKPRLAASAQSGVCAVPTPNVSISELRYQNARVHVIGDGRSFDVDVPDSNLVATNGVFGERENALGGTVNVWGHQVELPNDDDGLDPDYDAASFIEAYACTDDLAQPPSFTCAGLGPVLAQGAARLSVLTLGSVAFALEADTRCGFSSDSILDAVQLSAPVGQLGEATFKIEACTLEFPADTVLKTACDGVTTLVGGKLTVKATKTMRGRLTGDRAQPVVPMDDAPVTFHFERIDFENYSVHKAPNGLSIASGALSGKVTPRTAMDSELRACGGKTEIAKMEDLRWLSPAQLTVRSPDGRFSATVEDSSLAALNGHWTDGENLLSGNITLNGERYLLPAVAGDVGLDPEYTRASFDASWQCGNLDLQAPFECHFAKPLAQGAGQLGVLTLGTLASYLDTNTTCGFASDAVIAAQTITGDLGAPGGTGVFTVERCELTFSEPTVLREDCNGKKTWGLGKVRLSGTKTLQGYVSGDLREPIVPTTWDPARLQIRADFERFEIWTEPGTNRLTVHSGQLSGTVAPRTAIDTTNGACALPTAVAQFSDVAYQNANITLSSEGKTFDLQVSASNLGAVNGPRDGLENHLGGSLTMDGQNFTLPLFADEGLDPEYDRATFMASFACEPNLKMPTQLSDCDMTKPLGEGTARLLISALGAVTSVVNADTDCGYSKLGVLTDPVRVEGDAGQMGLMEWRLENCVPDFEDPQEDCLRRQTHTAGEASITGHRVVEGLRDEIRILFVRIDSIRPMDHNAVTVVHDRVVFNEFQTWDIERNAATPLRGITIHSGELSAQISPVTGRNEDSGDYDIPTKVAHMQQVNVGAMPVTINYLGKTFRLQVDNAQLSAFNGSWDRVGRTNQLNGQIQVNGKTISLNNLPLDPEYDQNDFDQRYACTRNLEATITPAP